MLIKPGTPCSQVMTYDKLFYAIRLANVDEFICMQDIANENTSGLSCFPENGFSVRELVEAFLDSDDDRDPKVLSLGTYQTLILDNHVGMAIKMIADENTWFFRLQVAPESFSQVNRCTTLLSQHLLRS